MSIWFDLTFDLKRPGEAWSTDWPVGVDIEITFNLGNRNLARGSVIDRVNPTATAVRPQVDDLIKIHSATHNGFIFKGVIVAVRDRPAEDPNTGVVTEFDAIEYAWAAAEGRIVTDITFGSDPVPLAIVAVGDPAIVTTRGSDDPLVGPHGFSDGDIIRITGTDPNVDGDYEITVTGVGGPYNFSIPIAVATPSGGNAFARKLTPLADIVERIRADYLAEFGITLKIPWFKGTRRQFLIQQAEYYRWVSEGDVRLLTFFSGDTLTAYRATTLGAAIVVFEGMAWDEKAQLVGAANAIMWGARQGFVGSEARWFLQQAEFYRYVPEGDARLQTFLSGDTLTAYDALYTADIEAGLTAIIAAMPVDEKAAFDAGYAIASDMVPAVGTEEQFLLQQAEYYRWMESVEEPDARLLTWFYAATLTAYDTLMNGAVEDSLADIVDAMATDERAALDEGYADAILPVEGLFKGSISQLLIQQAEFYRYLQEGDSRLLTFFYAPTLAAYAIRMAEIDDDLDDIIADMAVDELAAFDAAYAEVIGPLVEKMVIDNTDVISVFKALAERTGWVFRFTADDALEWFEVGKVLSTFMLDGDTIRAGLRWQRTRTKTGNTVKLSYGTDRVVDKEEILLGDGVTRVFPLKYRPLFTPGSTAGIYDYAAGAWRHVAPWTDGSVDLNLFEWTYDPTIGDNGAIVQLEEWGGVTGWPPLGDGVAVKWLAAVQFPQTVTESDPVDVALRGHRDIIRSAPDVFDEHSARQIAQALLAQVVVQPRTATVPTRAGMSIPGNVIDAECVDRAIELGTWLIQALRITEDEDGKLAYNYTILEGDVAVGIWQDYLRSIFGGGGSGGAGGSITLATGSAGSGGGGSAPPPAITAGKGLTQPGATVIDVGAGDGIEVTDDAVLVKLDGTTLTRSAAGLRLTHEPFAEEMVGDVDGVNKVFTTTEANPRRLVVALNGLKQEVGIDLEVTAANEVTFYYPPIATFPRDRVTATYERPV